MRLPWQRGGEATQVARRPPPTLPAAGTPCELVLSDGKRLHGRIARPTVGELDVLVLFNANLSPRQLEGACVELTTAKGILRLGGDSRLTGADLVAFDNVGVEDAVQRREHVRVRTNRPVLIRSEAATVPLECSSIDLSGGGMLIAGASHLRSGERVEFRITTSPQGPPISGSGVVVRVEADGRRAILFDQISEGNQRRLIKFLFECQRQERQRGLEGRDGR